MTLDHDVYLLVAILTHGLVGYALVRGLTRHPPAAAVGGAVVPDVDLFLGPLLGVPVAHRGAIHTPAALAVVAVGALLLGVPRRVLVAFGVGFLSHLALDSATSAGVMWLFPASTARVAGGVPVHGLAGTVALWLSSLAILGLGPRLWRPAAGDE